MPRCAECGMETKDKREFHPYAACLMFRGCHNGDTVRGALRPWVELREAKEEEERRKRWK